MRLEFEKVIKSIRNKDEETDLRKKANGLIADVLSKNDGQMKSSLDLLKKNLSETLRAFKGQLDAKFERRL